MQFGDSPHERQTEAEAPLRTIKRPVVLGEQVENLRQQLRGYTGPRVLDLNHGILIVSRRAHLDRPALISVFGGVVEQVDDDLHQSREIAANDQRRVRE
jgi:hypothetical protein